MARIEIWNGDICDLEVDAIVAPANGSLWTSTGVAGEIKRAGGDSIELAAIPQGPIEVGDAVVTTAGGLAAQAVFALRGAATYEAFSQALQEASPMAGAMRP